tara:strand:- start:224 stop:973 length:750 start_codon:yes stop_codon:yes gene_type:complete
MIKNIYITILLITQICISQNIDTNCVKSDKTNPEIIINSYIQAIGGYKKIKKIKTLQKNIETIITNSGHIKMNTKIMYKNPNLYSYRLSIPALGEIQSTKYDGVNCIIKQNLNNKKIEEKIEGELLEQKKIEFYPFPILKITASEKKTKLIDIEDEKDSSIYVIELIDGKDKKTQLFFDCESNLLVMKKSLEKNKINTIKYENYQDFKGVLFPFNETHTIEIDDKIVQEKKHKIIDIVINKEIMISEFQ